MLESKLSPPLNWGESLLEREPLLALLKLSRSKRLVLLNAAAGYGKSTLMSQWYRSLKLDGVRCAWLTLDGDDNDPSRLFSYLRNALEGTDSAEPADAQFNDQFKISRSHAALLANLFAAESAPEVLFVDEFEVLLNPQSIELLWLLVQQLPSGCQLVLASRHKPDWGLSKLKLASELLELDQQELRFTSTEIDQLSRLLLSQGVDHQVTDQLTERTEGWIAGIRLAMLCFPQIEDAQDWVGRIDGDMDEIRDFLTEEVFANLDPQIQQFLLYSAIPNRISAPLCEALTGMEQAQPLLEQLCAGGFFIQSLDPQRQWFRLHGLMRQYLIKRLQLTEADAIGKIHLQAARWFKRNQLPLEAVHHAIAARDLDRASAILEPLSRQLVFQGQVATLTDLARQLGDLGAITSTELLANLCWAHLFLHQHQSAEQLIERLKLLDSSPQGTARLRTAEALLLVIQDRISEAAELAQSNLPQLSEGDLFERGVLSNILAYAHMCTLDIELSQQYQLKARVTNIEAGSCFGTAYADMMAALRECLQGNLLTARERFAQIGRGPEYSRFKDPLQAREVAKYVINGFEVALLYELNQLEQAEQLLEQHFPNAADNTAPPDTLIAAYLTRARLCFARQDYEAAYIRLEEGEVAGVSWGLPRIVRAMRWERVRFALLRGELEAACAFAETTQVEGIPSAPDGFVHLTDECNAPWIARLRLAIHLGDAATVLKSIEPMLEASQQRPCRMLTLKLLKALALHRTEQPQATTQAMTEAIDLGRSIGAVRSLIDEGPMLIELLKPLYQSWSQRPTLTDKQRSEYARMLLETAGECCLQQPVEALPVEPLSERELEILGLVGMGLKNEQIADRLKLSVNTVKWHLRRAYEKLGVRSRTEALAEARRLALIE